MTNGSRAFAIASLAGMCLGLTHCGGGNGPGSPPGCKDGTVCVAASPSPSPGVACSALAVVGPALLSPMPGATGIATAPGQIEIAASNTYVAKLAVELVAGNGTPMVLGTLAYASPAPNATPGGVYFSYPALTANTVYSVDYKDVSGTQCPLAIESGGSFST